MVTLDAAKRRTLAKMPDTQVVCRSRGHRWPDMDPSASVAPSGVISLYDRNLGVFQQTEICERCGKQRSKVTLPPGMYPTLPNGPFAPGARWAYVDPKDWISFTEDDAIERRDITAELDYRMKELLYKVPREAKK